jgi:lipopolysaccharide transport system ATP-binding protein
MKPILEIQSVSKKFSLRHEKKPYLSLRESMMGIFRKDTSTNEDFFALRDVSFNVQPGESLGIIGKNGAGKSTLLKVLSKITPPSSGKIIVRGRIASLLEVGTGFHPELSGRENIFLNGSILGMKRKEIVSKFDEIVDFSGTEKFLDTPLKHFSSGMQLRLAFSVAAFLEPEILVIDEVLAVGDSEFQKKCIGKMEDVSRNGRTILFVSHNMNSINNLCKNTLLLSHGTVLKCGNTENIISTYLSLDSENNFSKTFENKPVKSVSIQQVNDTLVLKMKYAVKEELRIPVLGFTIKDSFGNTLFGSNPLYQRARQEILPSKEGEITVTIIHPKLWNGIYKASIWFGNGLEDFFIEEDCLTFEVINMVTYYKTPPENIGAIAPEVDWLFETIS